MVTQGSAAGQAQAGKRTQENSKVGRGGRGHQDTTHRSKPASPAPPPRPTHKKWQDRHRLHRPARGRLAPHPHNSHRQG